MPERRWTIYVCGICGTAKFNMAGAFCGACVDAHRQGDAEFKAVEVVPLSDNPEAVSEERRYTLWVCDACGDLAECEPGDECEVCCEGTIQRVQFVPLTALTQTQERAEGLKRERDEALTEVRLDLQSELQRRAWQERAERAEEALMTVERQLDCPVLDAPPPRPSVSWARMKAARDIARQALQTKDDR